MNVQCVLAVVTVILIVSLETQEGPEPHCHTQDSSRGQLSAQSHGEPRDGEGGKAEPSTGQGPAGPECCSGHQGLGHGQAEMGSEGSTVTGRAVRAAGALGVVPTEAGYGQDFGAQVGSGAPIHDLQ